MAICMPFGPVSINESDSFKEIDCITISKTMNTTRIIRYHAPDRAVVAACGIRRKEFTLLLQFFVQHGLYYSRLRHHIVIPYLNHVVHVFCKVHDDALAK